MPDEPEDWTTRTMGAWASNRSNHERGDFKGQKEEGRRSHELLESADPRETFDPDREQPDNNQNAKRGGGIHIKSSHKGLLHKNLGVPSGKPISTAKLESAKADAGPAEKKRIVFAENARRWNKG